MKTALIIPARYGSSRLPGKPLLKIAGKTMIGRVYAIAHKVAQNDPDVDICIATDDTRITDHCDEIGAPWVMTDPSCPSGTDRVRQAVHNLGKTYDFVINLQGDAPLTPPHFIQAILDAFRSDSHADVVTPVACMTWNELDSLRNSKQETPFSGTCAVIGQDGYALWFSKNIIPAIRKEEALRKESDFSPVHKHIGLYGYKRSMLERYAELPESHYEKLEGLEQLRVLENGFRIKTVVVDYQGYASTTGVDSPEDITRVEELLKKYGDVL